MAAHICKKCWDFRLITPTFLWISRLHVGSDNSATPTFSSISGLHVGFGGLAGPILYISRAASPADVTCKRLITFQVAFIAKNVT